MDRLSLVPIIRGAYLELGKAPLLLLYKEEEPSFLPELKLTWTEPSNYSAETRSLEKSVGRQAKEELARLALNTGSLPAGVRVPGVGSFYAGSDYAAVQAARSRQTTCFVPRPLIGRADIVRGRIALVTGGAQGFGAEIARGLADNGAYVIVADIDGSGARAFADELNGGGVRRALALTVDAADEDSVRKMAHAIVRDVGGLDLLVSNAGVLRAGSVLDMAAQDFDFVTKINYRAFFLVTKYCAPVMIRQQAGGPSWKCDILQVNSKSGLEGSNKNAAYAGGKFGGIGLVQSFALELVEYGIKVNAVCPGNFFDGPLWSDPDSGLFVQYLRAGKVPGAASVADVRDAYEAKVPMGRGCRGEDVLRAILYCVEQEYETGQAVPVTGGQVMLK